MPDAYPDQARGTSVADPEKLLVHPANRLEL
jgi:hypothetical protein